MVLPCGHAFHGPCIDRWLRSGVASCPNCRAFVPPKDALEQITQLVHTPRHPCAASHWISASEAYRNRIYEFAFQCVADARRVRKSKRLRLPPDRRDMVRIYCAILFFRALRRQRDPAAAVEAAMLTPPTAPPSPPSPRAASPESTSSPRA